MKCLETKRLIMRGWQETDLDDLYEYAKVEGIGEMAGWPHHKSIETTKVILEDFIKHDEVYALVLKENNKVIGSLGIHNRTKDEAYQADSQREIGYVLSPSYWGKGLMVEAVEAAIQYTFEEIGVDILWCGHFDFNNQSERVIQKSGFNYYGEGIYEAKQLNKVFKEKKYFITRTDYLNSKRSSEVKS